MFSCLHKKNGFGKRTYETIAIPVLTGHDNHVSFVNFSIFSSSCSTILTFSHNVFQTSNKYTSLNTVKEHKCGVKEEQIDKRKLEYLL